MAELGELNAATSLSLATTKPIREKTPVMEWRRQLSHAATGQSTPLKPIVFVWWRGLKQARWSHSGSR